MTATMLGRGPIAPPWVVLAHSEGHRTLIPWVILQGMAGFTSPSRLSPLKHAVGCGTSVNRHYSHSRYTCIPEPQQAMVLIGRALEEAPQAYPVGWLVTMSSVHHGLAPESSRGGALVGFSGLPPAKAGTIGSQPRSFPGAEPRGILGPRETEPRSFAGRPPTVARHDWG